MAKYLVNLVETVIYTSSVEVEADSEDETYDIGRDEYVCEGDGERLELDATVELLDDDDEEGE